MLSSCIDFMFINYLLIFSHFSLASPVSLSIATGKYTDLLIKFIRSFNI